MRIGGRSEPEKGTNIPGKPGITADLQCYINTLYEWNKKKNILDSKKSILV